MKKILTLVLTLLLASHGMAQRGTVDIDMAQLRKLQMAQVAVASLYVDSVDQQKLTEDAIRGMLDKLDPHSSYSDAETTKKLTEPLQGNFEGIGVQFNVLEDTLVVIQTVSKGPSEKAGIRAGDRIVSVDGLPIAGVKMSRDSIMKKLRGPKGTKPRLGVVRRGVSDVLYFTVTRDKIPVNTLDASYIIAPGVGYLRLGSFGATSDQELRDALRELLRKGAQSLILDLSLNGGGYLGAAQEVAGEFLQRGDLIVYTEGRNAERQVMNAAGGGLFTQGRLLILVDEYTASAAEIVSGAVQDHDRGTLIGRRTFGKGLVQRPIPLPDGSMIRLTTAHYFTPSGRCIQKPYVKGKKEEYDDDLEQRYKHGELLSTDSIHLDSTKIYYTLREHRVVYGGGGIMPDIFVPLDTTTYSKFYLALRRNNLINEAALKYTDNHRQAIRKKYKQAADFIEKYEVPAELTDSILAVAKGKKLEPADEAELQRTLPELRFTLKSLILYDLWDRSEYYQFVNRRNPLVRRALQELGIPVEDTP